MPERVRLDFEAPGESFRALHGVQGVRDEPGGYADAPVLHLEED